MFCLSYLKQTFPPTIWIFIEGEVDGIESRLPFKIFSILSNLFLDKQQECDLPIYGGGGTGDVIQSATPSTAATTTPVRYVQITCNFMLLRFHEKKIFYFIYF